MKAASGKKPIPHMPDNQTYFKSFDRKRLTHQRYGEQRIAKGLREQIDTIIEILPQAGAGALLASLDQFSKIEPVERAYQDIYGRVGGDFARDQFQRLTGKSKKAESDWIEYMRNFALTQSGTRIKRVSEVTLQRVRRVLEQGVSEGLGTEEIARRIEQSNAVNRVRARVIARTEIISASNAAADLGARSTGLTLEKEWLTAIDGREREDHAIANGQTVAMDEDFIVGGEQAKYPGDPRLSAENVIQCRCVHLMNPV